MRGVLLGLLVLLAGCPPRGQSAVNKPEAVLKAYSKALRKGDYDAAYQLMSAEFREKHKKKAFIGLLREHDLELKESVAQLSTKPQKVNLEAQVKYGEGETLRLVLDQGSWRIASDPVDFYGQRTPKEALRSFIRAIERRRYDVVLRFVPNKWAESMTVAKLRKQWEGGKSGEVEALLKNLKANLGAPIHHTPKSNKATMPYGDRFEVRFVREDGVWKIEDPD